MKVSANFDVREFVPKSIWDKWGENSTWFVNPQSVKTAEFYKSKFTTYFKNKYGNEKVVTVLVVINNWHIGKPKQWSGLRLPQSKDYREQSQHTFINAFDCELFIVFSDGRIVEVDYKEIHEIIEQNQAEFLANGVAAIESIEYAPGWLHTDHRWIPNQKNILIVKPSK